MTQPKLRGGAGPCLAIALLTAGCSFEEVRCQISFETDAAPGVPNSWDTQACNAQIIGDSLTQLEIHENGQYVKLSIYGGLSEGVHELEIEYSDGVDQWSHDGGSFFGIGPACTVVLDSAAVEDWTKHDRVRMAGAITCTGQLTTYDNRQLSFTNASFDVFTKDDYALYF